MNVHLTDEQKKFVSERVSSGRFASASEVIRAGLRLLADEEDLRAELRSKIAMGVAQAKAGELIDGDEVLRGLLDRIERHRKKDA